MAFSSTLTRAVVSVATLPALLMACAPATQQPAAEPAAAPGAQAQSSPASVPLSNPIPQAPAICGDLSTLSTRDKLAQLLMVGVTSGADARAVVADHRVGGIFIGSWTDRSMLTDGTLAEIAANAQPLPLAVSVDEEGGRVQRLSALIGSQPSPRVLADTKTPDEVYQIALERGRKMRGHGITVDFAPVVDVTDAADNTVIGDRSFGSDPAVVTEYAGAYARGLRDGGVLPVLKHFPGHGNASGDSHVSGVVTPPLEELKATDLVPYRTLTTQGPVGVMMGHMQVPGLTGADPASLSGAAVALLRNGAYGGPSFNGPVFSDDLSSMGAINQRFGVPEAVLRSLQAGVDVALWVSTGEVPAVLDRLEAAVAAGELQLPAVEASLHRVAGIKGPARC
ncbi:glycoside hydrolase family 3 N-terminal domain-containing protein [[Mycobacterium] burgundiense]|uniref:beta-N-acetylhexosaminidase n=1 Tax=[Mycobacterium] burgundiense TaxID=3064286 RepID=A0ABM9M412_9MYCO|nr:glycoside hydrolase family 3 N-terminal domain-containing protein [Mycolicibacterium sp. MU0053]CAJ1509886.1 glycoside hydrolase family 3 N-terminal domain-containing protein [Mycolicibacterium sp. MU0053]